jgi:putative tricarboxylic transport membrane protein
MPEMRVNDAILGVLILLFSLFILFEARRYIALPGVPYGPGFFPSLIACAMFLGGSVMVIQGLWRRRETGWCVMEPWTRNARTYITLGSIFWALLFYILFSETLGFLVTSVAMLMGLMLWTRGLKRTLSSLIISICFSVMVYMVFSRLLRVPLPRGIMEGIL